MIGKFRDRLGVAIDEPAHVVVFEEGDDPLDLRRFAREELVDAHAVEAGLVDHVQLLVERVFLAVGPAPLHGPQRLVDE